MARRRVLRILGWAAGRVPTLLVWARLGVLFALEKQLGEPVKKGELLALVDSADVGKAKAAYLTARAVLESRETILASLKGSTNVPPRSVAEAEAAAREARAGLYSARQG